MTIKLSIFTYFLFINLFIYSLVRPSSFYDLPFLFIYRVRHMFCNKVSVQLFPKFSINTKNIFLEREHGHRTQIYYYYSKKSPLFFIQAVKRFGNPSTAALKVSCGIFVHSR